MREKWGFLTAWKVASFPIYLDTTHTGGRPTPTARTFATLGWEPRTHEHCRLTCSGHDSCTHLQAVPPESIQRRASHAFLSSACTITCKPNKSLVIPTNGRNLLFPPAIESAESRLPTLPAGSLREGQAADPSFSRSSIRKYRNLHERSPHRGRAALQGRVHASN
jgi:hypothetical protein